MLHGRQSTHLFGCLMLTSGEALLPKFLFHVCESPLHICVLPCAARAKGMMAERLAVSESKLMKLHHDDVIRELVEAKTALAQTRFESLEIQVSPPCVIARSD